MQNQLKEIKSSSLGPIESMSDSDFCDQFNVNLFGNFDTLLFWTIVPDQDSPINNICNRLRPCYSCRTPKYATEKLGSDH